MTPRQRLNLLNRFEEAVGEHAFGGSKHPQDAAYWAERYRHLKRLMARELSVELHEDEEEFDQ